MDKKYLLSLVSGLLLVPAVSQADYFTEFELNHTKSEFETNSSEKETTSNALLGTIYFSDVKTENVPLAEAAFLSKASSLSLVYGQGEYERKGSPTEEESDIFGISGEIFISDASLYLAASYLKEDIEAKRDGETEEDSVKIKSAAIGGIIGNNVIVFASYEKFEELKSFGPAVKAVIPFSNQAISLEGSIQYLKLDAPFVDDDSGVELAFRGNYYFSPGYGVGIHWGYRDIADADTLSVGIQASAYFTENIGIEASYTSADWENDYENEEDIDTISLSGIVRF
tara:strand:- start:258 stop:1109 length:852 start_codon:yes stop_codon:yes gene_type:complete